MKSMLEVFAAVSLPFPSWGKESEAVGRSRRANKTSESKNSEPSHPFPLTRSPVQKGKHQSSQPPWGLWLCKEKQADCSQLSLSAIFSIALYRKEVISKFLVRNALRNYGTPEPIHGRKETVLWAKMSFPAAASQHEQRSSRSLQPQTLRRCFPTPATPSPTAGHSLLPSERHKGWQLKGCSHLKVTFWERSSLISLYGRHERWN